MFIPPAQRIELNRHTPLAVYGQFLGDVALLHQLLHGVGRAALSGAVVLLEDAGVLLVQRLLPPAGHTQTHTNTHT